MKSNKDVPMQQSRKVRADTLGQPLVPLASIQSATAASNRCLRTSVRIGQTYCDNSPIRVWQPLVICGIWTPQPEA